MLRGSTGIPSTLYSHLVRKITNTTTGFGVWTDKLGYSYVSTQLNTFYRSHEQSKQLSTEEQLSLLNKILQNIKHPARSSVVEDSSLVKRQKVTDDSRQSVGLNFGTSAPRRVKYYKIIFEDSNPFGCEAV
jgi:hypothetical protein